MPSFADLIPVGGLIISCQASAGNPLRDARVMALMARAGELGGAVGVRANGTEDIRHIRASVFLPVIGINKQGDDSGVFITPSAQSALDVIDAGATIVALDGTNRPRPDGSTLADQIQNIKSRRPVPIIADVDSFEAGIRARAIGADAVATTLSGYTGQTPAGPGPDLKLVAMLADRLDCPVIAEGRIRDEHDALAAHRAGAHAVVVGTALTNPLATTRRFVRYIGERIERADRHG